ncbi:MAG TPA: ZIP family metal transporter [Candidatus Paceibacterota bacterium]|nr:ZIP family metal transporter [Candidatus Paceibacterota bacterium]
MLLPALYSFASVLIVSAISLIGLFTLSLKESLLRKYVFVLVSVAVGALLGDAFIHLIPESLEEIGMVSSVSYAVLGGILLFFILEKFLHWHHHQGIDADDATLHPSGKMILVSDSLHNFIDGLIIGASYLISFEVGLATTLAVILHEIPQEIGDFGVLISAGYSKMQALWLNFLSALFAVLGTGLVFVMGSYVEGAVMWLAPIAAGGFIYVAMSDLIPELHKHERVSHALLQIVSIVVGIAALAALALMEPAHAHDEEDGGTHTEEAHAPHGLLDDGHAHE